jgi:hypothetical protein
MSKKLISMALTATTVAWALGMAVLPVAANAQTTATLQAQIAALLAQINQLQGQLNTSGTTTTTNTSTSFTRDLTLGSKGADVSALQQMLISKGFLTAVSAPTGYFGVLTRTALGKFQAANGISPTAGYFGPKTRAFVNSMNVGSGTTTTTTTTTTGTGTTTAPASGLSVSVASDNPPTGSLITGATAGAARVPVLAVNFTAGNAGPVTLTGVNFHKTGVLSDSSIAGAYLTQNGKVVAQYNSINQGVVSFSGMNLQIAAGQTLDLQLAIDVSAGLAAGNTVGFALSSASDVSSWTGANVSISPAGTFPINGNTFTVTTVTNPSLATLTITSSSIGTTVTAGTQGNLVGAWNFSGQNSKVWLKSLNFRVIGSANKTDLRNVKLMVNGVQVGQTLATAGQDGTAFFDGSANPGVLNTGSNNVQLFADVMGSPSYNFQFEILNSYDVLAVDSQYNVPITVTNNGGIGTAVTIQQGQITVSQDQGTPTGNIAKGQSQITLAKFDVYAAGEAVKVKFIGFALHFAGVSTTSTLNQQLQNIALTDDAGGQVGTTINQPPSATTCTTPSPAFTEGGYNRTGGQITSATVDYADCFGTSGSPINYIIPANTTRVLSLKADIQTTASFSNVTAQLLGETNNLQGLTSSVNNSGSGATGSALTLASSNLIVSANNALGNQNVSAGVTGQKIGSYAMTASSAEGVSISNVSVQLGGTVSTFQNLKVLVNGTQFGTTQGSVNGGTIYTFSGSPFTVPAGSTVNLDVFADTLSSATSTVTPATTLVGLSGTGLVSNAAISLTGGSVIGQNISFAGNPSITIGQDSNQPAAGVITMGSSQNTLAIFRLSETSNIENVKVTDLIITDTATSTPGPTKAAFSNLSLYNGSTLLGSGGSAQAGSITNITPQIPATSTITVVQNATSGVTTYQPHITLNGVADTFQPTFATIGAVSTSTNRAAIATAIASTLNNDFNGAVTASANGAVVNVTSTNPAATALTIAITSNDNTVTYLFVNNAGVAQTSNSVASNNGIFTYSFHLATPIIVPQNQSVSVTLKGDAATFASAGATDNSKHVFSIVNALAVTALGATSNKQASPITVANATGNTQTVLRSTATVSGTPSSFSQSGGKLPFSQIGSVIVTANNAGAIQPNVLTLTFGGNGATANTATFLATVVLKDQAGNDVTTYSIGPAVRTTATTATGGTVTWTFPTTSPLTVSAGTSVALQLWASTNVITPAAQTSESLSATVQNPGDFQYFDGTDATAFATPAISLATTTVPVTVSSLSWGVGQ